MSGQCLMILAELDVTQLDWVRLALGKIAIFQGSGGTFILNTESKTVETIREVMTGASIPEDRWSLYEAVPK